MHGTWVLACHWVATNVVQRTLSGTGRRLAPHGLGNKVKAFGLSPGQWGHFRVSQGKDWLELAFCDFECGDSGAWEVAPGAHTPSHGTAPGMALSRRPSA